MRISYQWLGEYLDTGGMTPQEAAHLLTMTGTKVESVQVIDLSAIVVGRILEQKDHPLSNKPLWIHQVDIGGGKVIQIIAGAPNAVKGTIVPVALPGTRVPSGTLVRDGKIVGEAAQGMLCSADELLLGEEREPRIMLLDRGEPGESLAKYIPIEAIFEAEITPNRPDCLGHLGVARELAAASGRDFKADFMPAYIEGLPPPSAELIAVAIDDPDLCSRFVAVPVTGVKVGPSPDWVQRRLRAAGVRPISNVVDATAYVMLEHGKPTHVFDLAKLAGAQLTVRHARDGESLLCLDGQTRKVRPGMLVVADAKGPVAIGGIIGGEESGVSDATTAVVIESAGWDGVNIRATSRALGLRTEASLRHEKGLAPEMAMAGARRAAALIREWAGGEMHSDWVDVYPRPQQPVRVQLEPRKVDDLLGVHVPLEESESILRRLGFQVRSEPGGQWDVLPPVFRLDVELPEDIVEEVGRIYGIARIPATLPGRRHMKWEPARADDADWEIREVLAGAGFEEAVTPALVSGKLLGKLGLDQGARSLINPMSDELDTMRTSLLPSLLAAARLNQNRTSERVDLFELARVYRGAAEDGLADEPVRLTVIAQAGDAAGREGFLRLKSVMDRLAADRAAGEVGYEPASSSHLFHPGRTARLTLRGKELGVLGELHPSALIPFDLEGRIVALDIDLATLLSASGERKAVELPRYPAVQRDLAVVVEEVVPARELQATLKQAAGVVLESVRAFDEYRGGQVQDGRKSIAFTLTFRSPERTLTDAEVEGVMSEIRKALEKRHRAGFRS